MSASVIILFGSVTGQAKAISEEVERDLLGASIPCRRFSMSRFAEFKLEQEQLAVIVCSTTGDGEPPEEAARFWQQLKKKSLPDSHLAGLRFALLGLGDTNYANFCQMGKNFAQRLPALGATPICDPVFADDAVGLENFVEPWRSRLPALLHLELAKLSASFSAPPLPIQSKDTSAGSVDPVAAASIIGEVSSSTPLTLPKGPAPLIFAEALSDEHVATTILPLTANNAPSDDLGPAVVCRLHRYRCLTSPAAVKRTLEIELVFPLDSPLAAYEPGDAFAIHCPNTTEDVEFVLSCVTMAPFSADTVLQLTAVPGAPEAKKTAVVPGHLLTVCTIRHALRYLCDLRAFAPKKNFLVLLAEHCGKASERYQLQLLASRQGSNEYLTLCQERAGLVDILARFPSCRPPALRLIELLPALTPRFYSACSSPLVNSGAVHFVFNVVDNIMPEGQPPRSGLCTSWLDTVCRAAGAAGSNTWVVADSAAAASSALVPVRRRVPASSASPAGLLRLPPDARTPIIMIGPGTGIAPFVGFLEHRRVAVERGQQVGPAWLFAGFRNRASDFLFEAELSALQKSEVLSALHVALSRDLPLTFRYVQDAIRHHGAAIQRLIRDEGAWVFVCGNAKTMATAVDEALLDVLSFESTAEEATEQLTSLKVAGKYRRELFV